jgi:hypothetical protein
MICFKSRVSNGHKKLTGSQTQIVGELHLLVRLKIVFVLFVNSTNIEEGK